LKSLSAVLDHRGNRKALAYMQKDNRNEYDNKVQCKAI
jgi:hypothetical protein